MSYEKQTWKTGDIITSEGLNHIEEGIANNQIIIIDTIVNTEQIEGNTIETITLTKTFQEIQELIKNNNICFVKIIEVLEEENYYNINIYPIETIKKNLINNKYEVFADYNFLAQTINDYPNVTFENEGVK